MLVCCEVCGNEQREGTLSCRFCGSVLESSKKINRIPHRVVNIERGKPIVEQAIKRLVREVAIAREESVLVLTIIHGYGSTGKGGAIRKECRKILDFMKSKGEIKTYIPGEKFHTKDSESSGLLRRVTQLKTNENLNRTNKGVTLVEL